MGTQGGAGGDQGQREGQPGTPVDDLCDHVRLGGDPLGAEPVGQQLHGLLIGEQVEGQRLGAGFGDQSAELVAAGDQDEAAGGAG